MNTKQRKYKNSAMIFWTILLLLPVSQGFSEEKAVLATTEITLKGSAKGGILTLVEIPQRNCRCVSISTQSGESSESVAMRLADIINNSNPFEWGGTFEVIAEDGSLTLLGAPGTYAFAGTETGLGIPQPPTSLSGKYDEENNSVILNWQNPASGFDGIFIARYGFPFPTYRMINGSDEKYVHQDEKYLRLRDKKLNFDYFCIIGIRDGVPSSPAAIHLTSSAQEELFGIPFTNNIAPNWTAWSTGGTANEVLFEEAVKKPYTGVKGNSFNPIESPETKPFFQVIKTKSPNVVAGIWRKFLGLMPGHTYRISARLNTLEMDSAKRDWSFSLHATHNAPGRSDLTLEQLSGFATLPDGSKGAIAGRIALYEPGMTTDGTWQEQSTGKKRRGLATPDITLPAGADTITVWVRHSASGSSGVGIDWVKIEDLSVLADKPQG
jgi:hypothetical protein